MTLTASPETDLAVAKACGIDVSFVHCFERGGILQRNDVPGYTVFRPTTDLNDAFLAAEKFGLFGPDISLCWQGRKHGWYILDCAARKPVGNGPTPAIAICAAILKLAEKTQ